MEGEVPFESIVYDRESERSPTLELPNLSQSSSYFGET